MRQSIFRVAAMPPSFFPTPDSVVYNNSMFDGNTQGNRAFLRFLVPLQPNFTYLSREPSVIFKVSAVQLRK